MRPTKTVDSIRWLPLRNDSGETLPAFACARITGVTIVEGQVVTTVAKPSTTLARHYLINGPSAVANGKYGSGTIDCPAYVLYDTADTPAFQEGWGPKPSQWTIAKGFPGFTILGTNSGSGATSRTFALWEPITRLVGKADALVGSGSSGTVSIWIGGTVGSESDSTINVTVYNRTGADLASGAWCVVLWINNTWYAEPWECASS